MSSQLQLGLIGQFCGVAFAEKSQELLDDEVCCAAADGVDAAWVRLVRQHSATDLQVLRAGVGINAFRHGSRGSAAHADTPIAGLWTEQDQVLCDTAIVGTRLRLVDMPGAYRVASFAVRDAAGDTVGVLEVGRSGDAYCEQDLLFLRTLAQCLGAASQLRESADGTVIEADALADLEF